MDLVGIRTIDMGSDIIFCTCAFATSLCLLFHKGVFSPSITFSCKGKIIYEWPNLGGGQLFQVRKFWPRGQLRFSMSLSNWFQKRNQSRRVSLNLVINNLGSFTLQFTLSALASYLIWNSSLIWTCISFILLWILLSSCSIALSSSSFVI